MLARVELEGMERLWDHSAAAGPGGLLTIVPHHREGCTVTHFREVAGCISRMRWEHESAELRIWNIHIYGFSVDQLTEVEGQIAEGIAWTAEEPCCC